MSSDTDKISSEKYLATLVRGEVHYLRDIRFDHGIPTVVEEHHKSHLEEHAVDTVGDQDGELLVKDKFTFTPYTGPLEVGTPTRLSDAVRGDRDAGTADRLRAFGEREAARLARVAAEVSPAAPFDAKARNAEIEARSRRATDENPALPRARPPRFPASRATV